MITQDEIDKYTTLYMASKYMYAILKKEFPKCEFGIYIRHDKEKDRMIRGYCFNKANTNTYEIRNFAKKYPYFSGISGDCLGHIEYPLEEAVLVPNYIVLKEGCDTLEYISNLVTVWKLQSDL